jgi:hypothetical protein
MPPENGDGSTCPTPPTRPKRQYRRRAVDLTVPEPSRLSVVESDLTKLSSIVSSLAQSIEKLTVVVLEGKSRNEGVPPSVPADLPAMTHTPESTPPGWTDQEFAAALQSPRPSMEETFASVNEHERKLKMRSRGTPVGPRTLHGHHDHDSVTGEPTWKEQR